MEAVPKAELHVHLEGTAPPELVRRIAARNRLALPEQLFGADGRFRYTDFLDFLRTYDLAASVIRTAEDYRDITYEYLSECAEGGAIYVELIVSPFRADRSVVVITPSDRGTYEEIPRMFMPAIRQGPIYGGVAVARE